jgi:ABC-type protease/lipase transport system fused ATPase/permease subunit
MAVMQHGRVVDFGERDAVLARINGEPGPRPVGIEPATDRRGAAA